MMNSSCSPLITTLIAKKQLRFTRRAQRNTSIASMFNTVTIQMRKKKKPGQFCLTPRIKEDAEEMSD